MANNQIFSIELLNEINLARDQPMQYKSIISKYKKEKDDKNGVYDIYLKEGKLSVPIRSYNQLMDSLEKAKAKKILVNDSLITKVCENVYHKKIKGLKNFNNLQDDVYRHLESITSEFGRPAGNVSFIIDQGNKQARPIVLYNLINNPSFLNSSLQVFGCYRENDITVMYAARYFIPKNQGIDHLSDDCIEIEDDIIEETKYKEENIIEDPDMKVDEQFARNVVKVEKLSKIEQIDNELIKTIYVKKVLDNGSEENLAIQKRVSAQSVGKSTSKKKITYKD